jgi:SAM-dependent methyltransferase
MAPQESLDVLDGVCADIAPDDEASRAWHLNYASGHRQRLAEDLRLVSDHVPEGATILEIGATPPLLTAALAKSGFRVTGVDIDPSRYSRAVERHSLSIVRCDIERERMPFDDDSFDCVLCNEVFEHLRINPPETFAEIRRVLRPDGLLMLSTPNLYSYRGLTNLLVRKRAWAVGADPFTEYGKLTSLGHMGHVREYTPAEIRTFLERCGFRVEGVEHRGSVSGYTERVVTWMAPALLPFVSMLARPSKGPAPGPGAVA